MQASLFSPLWRRVSDLRPRLRGGVRVQRQKYRGETWYLLADEASGRQHRINAAAYEFIGRFDGRASVNQLWSLLLERFGEAAPDQDEIVRTLQRVARERTVISVTHRLASVAGADQIIALDSGRLAAAEPLA